ncbi:RNA 2',3'-cyclic phosphodiesterase [Thetidibacter halocola]|uniref:RNA 2',3'-cyclic phosphodiesterase n=1 Tax=Thetidibacter halocola TaxID=2827239 RepID=A0A8J7WIB0_9RHOB|nr:RNA 2',3'-cyclic phosphodiesterase [Thetidibacter halocola]MBS0126141.1 RNA 2',3'-cyclic phosphodiesterase [Thetidibacter halocola]
MRAFIALPLPDSSLPALVPLQRQLRVGRPVPPENLHLTLVFLDEQSDEALEALHGELLRLRVPAFPVTLRGLSTMGGDPPRILAAEADASPPLVALHKAVTGAARRAGLVLPARRFRPHVTLTRLGRGDSTARSPALAGLAGFHHETAPLTAFALYESILRPSGAEYEALAVYPLIPT